MSFPERLLESLKQVGIKRHGAGAWLAKKTGTTVKAANKWLNGESLPLRAKVQVIAKATGTNIEWLEYGRGEMRAKASILEKVGDYHLNLSAMDTLHNPPLGVDEVEVAFLNESDLSLEKKSLAKKSETEKADTSPSAAQSIHSATPSVQAIATQKYRFNRPTLNQAGVLADQVVCCIVSGDSMAPVLPDGTIVAINTHQTEILDGKIYAIEHGGMLRIKYLYRIPFNGLLIRSANPDLQDEELNADNAKKVRILGRVFWYSVLL